MASTPEPGPLPAPPGFHPKELECEILRLELPTPLICKEVRLGRIQTASTLGEGLPQPVWWRAVLNWLKSVFVVLFLPDGYPDSIMPGFLGYFFVHNCAVRDS